MSIIYHLTSLLALSMGNDSPFIPIQVLFLHIPRHNRKPRSFVLVRICDLISILKNVWDMMDVTIGNVSVKYTLLHQFSLVSAADCTDQHFHNPANKIICWGMVQWRCSIEHEHTNKKLGIEGYTKAWQCLVGCTTSVLRILADEKTQPRQWCLVAFGLTVVRPDVTLCKGTAVWRRPIGGSPVAAWRSSVSKV